MPATANHGVANPDAANPAAVNPAAEIRRRPRRRGPRRGVAIIVVLAVIAVALATAYSLLRSQATVIQIQANTNLRSQARQAAVTGLLVAMQRMSVSDWAGVNSTLVGSLGLQDSYSVTFTPGDASLSASDPDQPYRVTLVATGYSANTLQSGRLASYRVRAVMHLIRKQLAAEPTNWLTMLQYTLYQTGSGKLAINPPCQLQGSLRLVGAVQLGQDYGWSNSAEQRYLGDLNAMRSSSLPDDRPAIGNLFLPTAATDGGTLALLKTQLGLSVTNVTTASNATITFPTQGSGYRVYAGGPVYTREPASRDDFQYQLGADPATNPLGIYFSGSSISIGNNVTITGTLIGGGDVNITGSAVSFLPLNLPSLSGSTTPIRLPAILAAGNFRCTSGVGASITGIVATAGNATIDQGWQTDSVALVGHLIAGGDVAIHGRNEWELGSAGWNTDYTLFELQLDFLNSNRIPYFPVFMSAFGLNPNPLLTLKADPTLLWNHWQDPTQPLYVPASGDGGLRWELLSWTNNV